MLHTYTQHAHVLSQGVCGLPENYDSQRAFTYKVEKLSQLIQQSKYTVVLTGAGISTSAGVPDFRGPNGIWTKEEEDRKRRVKRRRVEGKKQKKNGMMNVNGSKEDSAKAKHNAVDEDCTDGSAQADDVNGTNINGQSSSTDTSDTTIRKRKQETTFNKNNNYNGEESSTIATKKKKFTSFENALPTYTHRALTHLILHPPPPPSSTDAADDASQESSSDDNDDDDNEEELDNNNTTTSNNNGNTDNDNNNNNNIITQQQQTRTYLHHIVTQNVDGLHRKTNLPRKHMSVLHGCIFTEICDTCQTEHVSPTEIQSIGLKHTGRHCTLGGSPPGSCPGKLKDTMLDWEDELPIVDWNRAQEECARADLVVCLGTSLRIEPAAELCTYPMRYPGWTAAAEEAAAAEGEGREILDNARKDYGSDNNKKKKGRKKKKNNNKTSKSNANQLIKKDNRLGYAVVNLQVTPYDDEAALVVRGKVDDVMKALMSKLGYNGDWEGQHNMLDGGREG